MHEKAFSSRLPLRLKTCLKAPCWSLQDLKADQSAAFLVTWHAKLRLSQLSLDVKGCLKHKFVKGCLNKTTQSKNVKDAKIRDKFRSVSVFQASRPSTAGSGASNAHQQLPARAMGSPSIALLHIDRSETNRLNK